MKNVCICGGGSLGHVVAGWLSAKGKAKVSVLTGRPHLWNNEVIVNSEGMSLVGKIDAVGSKPEFLLPKADVVILCYPGYMISQALHIIKPFLRPDAYVGSIFSSSGFFFEAFRILGHRQPLWGFQRVPFIGRIDKYGLSANILGYKPCYHIAVENVSGPEKEEFQKLMQDWFERDVYLLQNYYEASLTNSNPLLHTSRLYTMFGGENEGRRYPTMQYFYEDWTVEASRLLIQMDEEFFRLLKVLPVREDFLPTILDYYESHDAESLTEKISSIQGFKGIVSPMTHTDEGWVPDYTSRYFTEDFPHGLKYIWELAHEHGVYVPFIDKVYQWGISKLSR